jgi:hypothetical protein
VDYLPSDWVVELPGLVLVRITNEHTLLRVRCQVVGTLLLQHMYISHTSPDTQVGDRGLLPMKEFIGSGDTKWTRWELVGCVDKRMSNLGPE